MNTKRFLIIVMVIFFSGCVTSYGIRFQKIRDLSRMTKQTALGVQEVRVGMTEDEVVARWGKSNYLGNDWIYTADYSAESKYFLYRIIFPPDRGRRCLYSSASLSLWDRHQRRDRGASRSGRM